MRTNQAPGPNRSDALVFDLGAGMGAIGENGITRLDDARSAASKIIAAAPPGTRFTILGYALEAQTAGALGSPGARYP